MSMYFLMLLVPAALVILVSYLLYRKHITYKELCLHAGGVIVSTIMGIGVLYTLGASKTWDTELRTGKVISKAPVHVSCSHQYKCGESCSTDSKGNRTCVPIYCDEHAYDIDWDVKSTVGTFTIDRVDRRGTHEPPRFTSVKIGEPATDSFGTKNFLLIDKDRFKAPEDIMEKYREKLPSYPRVFDYYRIDRVVNLTDRYFSHLNVWLNEQLKDDARLKQVNIVVVITYNDKDFYQALREHWSGGKKNDLLLVYGINPDTSIKWFRANTFADGQENMSFIKQLETLALERKLDKSLVMEHYALMLEEFKRLPNETFEYMDGFQTPTIGELLFVMFFNLVVSIGIAVFIIREDLGEFNGLRKRF
ncbi:hypothetical protein KAMAJI_01630 [Serratia phage vB_SmaM-Kamaji]|nr:hypothetical protein KAMAJI_01630 [Serratia phage vB_SmaM-Kamaji]